MFMVRRVGEFADVNHNHPCLVFAVTDCDKPNSIWTLELITGVKRFRVQAPMAHLFKLIQLKCIPFLNVISKIGVNLALMSNSYRIHYNARLKKGFMFKVKKRMLDSIPFPRYELTYSHICN